MQARAEHWPDDKEFDLRDAVRKDVFIDEKHGNLAAMQILAARYLKALGEDEVLQRKLN